MTTGGALTYDDLCRAREDGNRYELIDGRLVLAPTPPVAHQRVALRLLMKFNDALNESKGEVYPAPLDVRLSHHCIVQPDLIVILSDRAAIVGDALIEGGPSLAVEIGTTSSRPLNLGPKLRLYARHGIPEFWFVDPDDRSITAHANPVGVTYRTVRQQTTTARTLTIPGFEVEIAPLFREPVQVR